MAEPQQDRDPDSLSEEISQYRLQEFRRQGRVFQSREITSVMILLFTVTALWSMGPELGKSATQFLREMLEVQHFARGDLDEVASSQGVLAKSVTALFRMAGPLLAIGFVVGLLGSYLQVGSVFSSDPLTPDLNKINPLQGIKKFFTKRHVLDSLRVIAKVALLGVIAWVWTESSIRQGSSLALTNLSGFFGIFGEHGRSLLTVLIGTLIVFAGIDYWLQRSEYRQGLRLTKQEAKQEHKEHEGDPLLKARIRTIQRDMARRRMMEAVKKADVVVTNPTHIAVAIKYDRDKMDAPRVVAKGADLIAQKIKEIAAEAGVPRVENVPLARTLYKTVKVGRKIPRNLFKAVAEILAHVYRLKGQGAWNAP